MFGFGSSSSKKLEDELFNLKYFSKQLQREAKKAEKEMTKEKEKVKKVQTSQDALSTMMPVNLPLSSTHETLLKSRNILFLTSLWLSLQTYECPLLFRAGSRNIALL